LKVWIELRGISIRAIERWLVSGGVGFIPALKGGAFSLILRNMTVTRVSQYCQSSPCRWGQPL